MNLSRTVIILTVDGSPRRQGQAPAREPVNQVVSGTGRGRRLPGVQAPSSGLNVYYPSSAVINQSCSLFRPLHSS